MASSLLPAGCSKPAGRGILEILETFLSDMNVIQLDSSGAANRATVICSSFPRAHSSDGANRVFCTMNGPHECSRHDADEQNYASCEGSMGSSSPAALKAN